MAAEKYLGNPNLKTVGVKLAYTEEQVIEYQKCAESPEYFIRNYVYIVHVDKGVIKFDLYDCQAELITHISTTRHSILMATRQSGKSETTVAYILWYILFNDYKNCGILANKAKTANMLLGRLKRSYELLPTWLQQGVLEWNKTSIELENGSKVFAAPTSASGIRGDSLSLLFLDEFALVPNNIADEFFASVWPTISSGKKTKVLISSTPKGFNLFWKFWSEAEEGLNDFKPFRILWNQIPGRDEVWLKEQLRALGEVKFNAEVMCEFKGSTNTLIPSAIVGSQAIRSPIKLNDNIKIYTDPIKKNVFADPDGIDHSYVTIVDTARGVEGDYSVAITIDVTAIPYEVVCVYRDNTVSPYAFPEIINSIVTSYNDSYLLIELNDAGGEVANILYREYGCTNMFFSQHKDEIAFSGKIKELGLRTTNKVKTLGCSLLKTLLINGQLIINDVDIVSEIGTFVKKRGSYAADTGYHDDLVMALVLFSWLTQQEIFKNLTDTDTRKSLFDTQLKNIETELMSFGFNNGIEELLVKPEDLSNIPLEDRWMFDERLQLQAKEIYGRR